MEKYSINQRVLIVKTFYQNQSSITVTMRKLREIFGETNVPTKRTILRVVNDFEEEGLSAENITAAQESVKTIHQHQFDAVLRSLVFKENFGHNFAQGFAFLLPQDHLRRRTYANRMLQLAHDNPGFHEKIIMSDEAHFHLNGYVNKQNSRFWGVENPQIIHHPLKVTVWCAIWSGGIIGPYFFENENGVTVTPQLHDLGLINMWYQQDGATSHTARITMQLLQNLFPQQVISRNGDVDWPPRSPDLTAPDFFLWGYLKSKVYANKPETLEQLKQNIRDEMNEIPREMCENVMKNVLKRARICEANRGGHLSDMVFHT
ncbi:hypothetical protein CVS40_6188 [Lucilia cuprina]|nr:hypothetical protein CVS40_6188 [Lucilia cuprina]